MSEIIEIAKLAKEASIRALQLSEKIKNEALIKISNEIEINREQIIEANKKDLETAKILVSQGELSESTYNRLKLDDNKLRDMIQGVKDIVKLEDPVNNVIWEREIADGITLKKVSCPIGLISVIFEARPDVISQITALAIKSSNAVILKGGKEATQTNKTIFEIIKNALKNIQNFPIDMVNLIYSREDVKELLKLDEYIDLIIPRGSKSLV